MRLAPRRSNPAHGRYGPISLITKRRIGLPGIAASASKIVKIAAVSCKAMHAKYRAISSRRSPIGKRDPVKASPRQPTNRSDPIRHIRTPFGMFCRRRFRRRSLRLRAIRASVLFDDKLVSVSGGLENMWSYIAACKSVAELQAHERTGRCSAKHGCSMFARRPRPWKTIRRPCAGAMSDES